LFILLAINIYAFSYVNEITDADAAIVLGQAFGMTNHHQFFEKE
jgi:hypothetical protein